MKTKHIILLLLIAAVSCKSSKVPPIATLNNEDSARIETKVVRNVVYRDTTIYIDVPIESKQTVKEDSSHLETSVAWSDAYMRADGRLYHSLENKPISLSTDTQVRETTERNDSIVYRYIKVEVPVEVEVIKEVEKDLNAWQRFIMKSGYLFWLLLIVYALYKLRKPLRKFIIGI